MTLSDKAVKEYKKIFKEEYGQDLSDAEAREQGERLVGFFKILSDIAIKDAKRREKLKKHPKGYLLKDETGTFTCRVCNSHVSGTDAWFDKWGIKCTNCQENIKNKVIPAKIAKDDSLYITSWQLKGKFKIHPQTAKKMVREGKLREKALKDKNGHIYHRLYLLKENKEFLREQVEGYLEEKLSKKLTRF